MFKALAFLNALHDLIPN